MDERIRFEQVELDNEPGFRWEALEGGVECVFQLTSPNSSVRDFKNFANSIYTAMWERKFRRTYTSRSLNELRQFSHQSFFSPRIQAATDSPRTSVGIAPNQAPNQAPTRDTRRSFSIAPTILNDNQPVNRSSNDLESEGLDLTRAIVMTNARLQMWQEESESFVDAGRCKAYILRQERQRCRINKSIICTKIS